MKLYFLFESGIIIFIAFIAWILFQVLYKSKKWTEIKNDVFVIIFFVSAALLFYYLVFA